MADKQLQVQTYLFINIGVTGLWDQDNNLSDVKLCIKPVSRRQLMDKTELDGDVAKFDFMPLKNYIPGRSLKEYSSLAFSVEQYEGLIDFLQSFPKPVALVAYNGFCFHYPIIKNAIKGFSGLTQDLRCYDLMQAVFELENGFGPQTPRDDGRLPWEFKRDPEWRSYRFSNMYLRTLGRDSGIDESITNRTKSDDDEGLPVPKLMAVIDWAISYNAVKPWLDKETSSVPFSGSVSQ